MTPWQNRLPLHSFERKASAIEGSVVNMLSATNRHVRAAIVQRSPSTTTDTSSASTTDCTSGSKSRYCQYNTTTTTDVTLPVALGVAIPLFVAFVLCFMLHRRYKKRQALEDLNDKHKSLDFGLGDVAVVEKSSRPTTKRLISKNTPEMQAQSFDDNERITRNRGISLDTPNPFILPPVLHDDRGSLHSLSRSQDDAGPYHPVHLMRSPSPSASPSLYNSGKGSSKDSSSVNTHSSNSSITKANLMSHAQKPAVTIIEAESPPASPLPSLSPESSPISKPEPAHVLDRKPAQVQQPILEKPVAPLPSPRLVREGTDQKGAFVPPPRSESRPIPPQVVIPSQAQPGAQATKSPSSPRMRSPVSAQPPQPIRSPAMSPRQSPRQSAQQPPVHHTWRTANASPRVQSYDDDATYADVLGIVQKETRALPTVLEAPTPAGLGLQGVQYDNPEQRANRVQSVYQQYFDDGYGYYYANGYGYDQEYYGEEAMIDYETGQFVVGGQPWATPVTRRAMTPPPRAPPRFRGSPSVEGRRSSSANRNAYNTHRGRAYSSTSAQPAFGPRGRQMKRPVVLPGPLSNLPTPHLLQKDSEIMGAIDFAPPVTYKDRQAGKAASPLLGQSPFAPRVRAFSPLASSFDDLHVMPSPHALRKSTSFTALDFAPQPRFARSAAGSSDAGSIRSGRSNLSAAQLASIRAGAYRVSRIPKEFVGTKDDFSASLKPSWDMRDHIGRA